MRRVTSLSHRKGIYDALPDCRVRSSPDFLVPMSLPEVTITTFSTEVLAQSGLTLVDFYGSTCPPCQRMLPIVMEIAEERAGRVKIVKADAHALSEVAARYRVNSLPNFVLFRNGEPIGQRFGLVRKADLLAWIDES